MKLSNIKALRRVALPLLRLTATDITMRHPHVPEVRFQLNSFRHKGYWYFSKLREEKTMKLFTSLIEPGTHVVEVGGHIGFISIFFMKLVGPNGRVTVFEPGSNNLPYIRRNLRSASVLGAETGLIEKAVGKHVGEVKFFEDSLTGQNNSAVPAFEGLKRNAEAAFSAITTTERVVPVTTLDSEFKDVKVDFIKIDVEGFEKSVLHGAESLIESQKPVMMVEIQTDEAEIHRLFTSRGWVMFLETGEKVSDASQLRGNVFVLHSSAHSRMLRDVFHVEGGADC